MIFRTIIGTDTPIVLLHDHVDEALNTFRAPTLYGATHLETILMPQCWGYTQQGHQEFSLSF